MCVQSVRCHLRETFTREIKRRLLRVDTNIATVCPPTMRAHSPPPKPCTFPTRYETACHPPLPLPPPKPPAPSGEGSGGAEETGGAEGTGGAGSEWGCPGRPSQASPPAGERPPSTASAARGSPPAPACPPSCFGVQG